MENNRKQEDAHKGGHGITGCPGARLLVFVQGSAFIIDVNSSVFPCFQVSEGRDFTLKGFFPGIEDAGREWVERMEERKMRKERGKVKTENGHGIMRRAKREIKKDEKKREVKRTAQKNVKVREKEERTLIPLSSPLPQHPSPLPAVTMAAHPSPRLSPQGVLQGLSPLASPRPGFLHLQPLP